MSDADSDEYEPSQEINFDHDTKCMVMTRPRRSSGFMTSSKNHDMFYGGLLDSQISDTQAVDQEIQRETDRRSIKQKSLSIPMNHGPGCVNRVNQETIKAEVVNPSISSCSNIAGSSSCSDNMLATKIKTLEWQLEVAQSEHACLRELLADLSRDYKHMAYRVSKVLESLTFGKSSNDHDGLITSEEELDPNEQSQILIPVRRRGRASSLKRELEIKEESSERSSPADVTAKVETPIDSITNLSNKRLRHGL